MRSAGLATTLVLLALAAPLAQTHAPIVTIDLVVTGTDGRPVTDLRPADLVVRLDGRPRPVTAIERVTAEASPTAAGLPQPYAANNRGTGRTTAVIVDVTRLADGRAAAIRAGLEQLTAALAPADRLALIPLSADTRPVDFTVIHQRVVDAAAALTTGGGAPRTARQDETAVEAMLAAVGRSAALLGAEPGVKTLVVLTEPFAATSRLRRAIQTLGEAAARHRIALYIAAPGTPTVPPTDGLHALAAGTGGAVVTGSWADIVLSERARVVVTLAADTDLKYGEPMRLLVAPARAGLTIRSRPAAVLDATATRPLESLTDMLRQPRTFTDLPLRLEAYPVLHSDRTSIRLLIVGETIDASRTLAWSEFALVSTDGRVVSQWTEGRDAVALRPLISGAVAPEGQYRLRWAASELSGRRGTVDLDVTARFTPAGAFQLSALMLGRLATDTFVTVLQPEGPDVEWYAEIYGPAAEGVTLTTRLEALSAAGAVLLTEPGRVLTSPDPSRRAMTGRVNVATLAPGDYQLRATLIVNGQDAGAVSRTYRKVR